MSPYDEAIRHPHRHDFRRYVSSRIGGRSVFSTSALILPGKHRVPFHRHSPAVRASAYYHHHISLPELPSLPFRFKSGKRKNHLLHSTSFRSAAELRETVPSGPITNHRRKNHLLRFRSGGGGRCSEALENQFGESRAGSARVLPCKFHELLHPEILVEFGTRGGVQGAESVLFQHRGDGYRFGKMEGREVHGKVGEMDEDSEEEQNL